MRRPFACRRGTTLLEVLACLAVLGLFVTGFVRHLGGAAAGASALDERVRAEDAARGVRALLSVEDPWAAPALRTFTLPADSAAAPGLAYDVRVEGRTLCSGAAMPDDNPPASGPAACADGSLAVRRWHLVLSWPTRFSDAGRDSVTSDVDVDLAPSSPSSGTLLP